VSVPQRRKKDERAALHKQLRLDDPAPVRYVRWITGFVTGDWGTSTSSGGALILAIVPGSTRE
jgi:ABC-type dipeptide/oligopeptide/nickel transport system permease component